MISRSSLGRLARNIFIRSRKRVTVRTLVAICWRRVAMSDYSLLGKRLDGDGRHGRPCRAKPGSPRFSAETPFPITLIIAAAYIASEPPFGHLLELLLCPPRIRLESWSAEFPDPSAPHYCLR